MIFVQRPVGADAPVSLTAPDGAGARELTRAREFYRTTTKGSFDFTAYKGADVKATLNQLFGGKCAYCESSYKATAPMDVEHFRPKGEVEDEPHHRGYWWLAANWENLLPSCIDCNRRRNHRVLVQGMTLEQLAAEREVLVGKQDQFPITGHRAFNEGDDCTLEAPLLIDPTSVDPSTHLTWSFDQNLSVAVPVVGEGHEDPVGIATIYTFALNRQGLVEARTEVLTALQTKMVTIRKTLSKAAAKTDEDARNDLIELAVDLIKQVRQFGDTSKEYSAFVNAFFRDQLDTLIEEYEESLRGPT
ncbi:uncharacterized protein (TIGR02646 family) [Paraburkholderia sp. HC6.4b]|uniref:HNH endonuclease n=1 Tax=unclassified Paraburkholderia TaxID=2615204 RepID=UPI00160A3BCE|nr:MULTISPECIES: HNH endonuclease [unclassified Paraburkholderia]MBB5411041.1 uncharacterized protein (TIGR02646 family) [Paraburkholderia sp. HC6.4b]MBB5455157.1 uncharacterized protein (TIGR02646 family) [Paraburkholderia sp. Kb1A]